MTIKIPLNKGMTALVDDEDSELSRHRWFAILSGNIWYARRNVPQVSGPYKYRIKALHRVVMGVSDPLIKVDHINGDGLDCRRENLRVVSPSENTKNVDGPRSSNKASQYLGVGRMPNGLWRARICNNGKLTEINNIASEAEAREARLRMELLVWGIAPRRKRHFIEVGVSTASRPT